MPCARREIERGHSGRCPRKGRKGGEGASSPEGGGGTGNPVLKGTRDAALPGRDSRPRRGPRALRGGWERDRAGGTPRSAVWDRGEREAAGPSTGESRAEESAAGSSGDAGLLLPRRRRAEGGRGQGPRARGAALGAPGRCPAPARSHQMKSVQWLQKVGCLKKRAVNLWFFTSCTFFCRRAPLRAKRTVLSSPSLGGGPAAGSAILRAGSREPEKCRPGAAGPRAAGPGGAGGGGR